MPFFCFGWTGVVIVAGYTWLQMATLFAFQLVYTNLSGGLDVTIAGEMTCATL